MALFRSLALDQRPALADMLFPNHDAGFYCENGRPSRPVTTP